MTQIDMIDMMALFILSAKMRFDQLRLRGFVIPRVDTSLHLRLVSPLLRVIKQASGRFVIPRVDTSLHLPLVSPLLRVIKQGINLKRNKDHAKTRTQIEDT